MKVIYIRMVCPYCGSMLGIYKEDILRDYNNPYIHYIICEVCKKTVNISPTDIPEQWSSYLHEKIRDDMS